MERLPTYEQLYASFRWNIPARYNIAADVCDRHATDPSKIALIGEGADDNVWRLTFRDIQRKANQLANLFVSLGLRKGDRVMLLLGQNPWTAIAHLAARARRRGGRHQRSPPRGISRKRNRRSAAQPARAGRVGLIAGRSADHLNVGCSADRRRWLGAPLAHEDSARVSLTRSIPPIFQCRLFSMTPWLNRARADDDGCGRRPRDPLAPRAARRVNPARAKSSRARARSCF